MAAPVVLASNRGPVSYGLDDHGVLRPGRGGGGLVAGLSGHEDAVWVCAALSEGDRLATARADGGCLDPVDTDGTPVRMLDIDPQVFARAYSSVANSTLWFVHHLLYDLAREPAFGSRFARDWAAYEVYNAAFADALCDEADQGARVLVQDYHLTLAPRMLRDRRPDLRVGHFSHTPWAPPEYFRLLPEHVGAQVLRGILGADRAGFLSARWAEAFARCCADLLGADVAGTAGDDRNPLRVNDSGRTTVVDVHPLGIDGPGLRRRGDEPDVHARLAVLRERLAGRVCVVRVDRTELSKNIVRGLEAYRDLLARYPEWRGRVVHLAFAYPSRHDLPVYREYTGEVQRVAQEINDAYGTVGWQPVVLEVQDDYPRSLAAYRLADVLLVNPVRDGMNLVAKEAPVLSEHGCAVVLSQEAGAADELGEDALLVNPFDVTGTADALAAALAMSAGERARRSARLADAATAMPPSRWLARQLDALDAGVGGAA
jgi:trehalose 6-phosphate synthase